MPIDGNIRKKQTGTDITVLRLLCAMQPCRRKHLCFALQLTIVRSLSAHDQIAGSGLGSLLSRQCMSTNEGVPEDEK